MTEHELKLAPGCFGGPMLFSATAKECTNCPFAERCGPVAQTRLVALRARLGVKAPPKVKVVSRPATTARPTNTGTAFALTKKVEELMLKIERHGIKITEALRQGRNPFATASGAIDKRFVFMGWTCHALIKLPNGIDRKALEGLLAKKMNWQPGTANSHACQAQQLLEAVGAIAVDDNGVLRLRA